MATTLCLVVIFIPVSFMSSISGRFLYQFGITAAVADPGEPAGVSFTLTPMMSARLLRGEMARHQDGHGGQLAAGLLSPHRRVLHRGARLVDAASRVVVGVGLRWSALSSIPLYGIVKQEYVPTDVDEAEFEVQHQRARGHQPRRDGRRDAPHREATFARFRGVRTVLATVGGSFLGGVNQAQMYVRIAPHEERLFSFGRLLARDADGCSRWRRSRATTRSAT